MSDKTPAQRVAAILEEAVGSDLTSWEKHEFLPSIRDRPSLSARQDQVLQDIERKVFGEDD